MTLFGSQHHNLVEWLTTRWWWDDMPVSAIQGFSGVGKTEVALQAINELRAARPTLPTVIFDCPETKTGLADDLLLTLAEELSDQSDEELLDALERGEDISAIFAKLLKNPRLIILKRAERLMIGSTGMISAPIAMLMEQWTRTEDAQGRLLLLSLRKFDNASWTERLEIKTLDPLEPEEAEAFLLAELKRTDRSVPTDRRRDVVTWLGCNPRAIRLLVSALAHEKLDDLIGLAPEAWEIRKQKVSSELLRQFEQALLQRSEDRLNAPTRVFLRRLSVLRRPVDRRGLEVLTPDGSRMEPLRDELLARFMIELRNSFYNMHPVLRAIMSSQMSGPEYRRAHLAAGRYHAGPFRARQIVGTPEKLSGRFIEARYHFKEAGSQQDLNEISHRFEAHFRARFQSVSPVPSDPAERDELIGLLLALLQDRGAAGLEYFLARCLVARGQFGDLDRALPHARRATGPQAPAAAWVLRMRIEGKIYGAAAVSKIAREGADVVPAESGLVSIYAVAAEILSQHGHFDESFELLNRGIREISSHQNVFSLYQLAAQISTQIGQSEEALQILRSGIDRVSADHGKFSLYQAIGNILNRNNESAQAIDWLLRGRTELTDAQAGHRLATAAVQIAYAEDCLERLRDAELGEQHDLLAIMTALLQEDFYRAATLGKKAIDRSPRALQCYGPTAFAFLCLGEPAKAKEITSRLPRESRHQIGAVRHWFAAFIALELELIDEVKSNVVAYLGRPLGAHEIVDRALLLKLWDSSPEMWGENVAFYFPRLPPGLTGLKETIVRHQYGGTALIEIEAPAPFAQTEAGRSFDSALVVSTMRPDEWFGLYVLGCYDRLKTVYAQQCRALSLIHALCKIDEVREGRRVGVIGGGAAGITAAAAAATKGAKVIVWELAEHLMPLQRQNTNRYLHPHIYHWPNISSDSKRADLPLLDWVADMSNGVAEQLRQRFDRVRGETGGAIEVRLGQIISNILVVGDRISPSGFRVLGDNGNIDEQVDVVIVAIGFGIEKRQRLGIETPPYWKDDGLDQTLDASPMKPRRILISGSGDGALIDILRVKLKDFRHDEILDLLPKDRAMSHLERELQRIEERAENARVNPRLPPVSLNREYSRLALPDSLKVELSGRIRRDTKVCFNFSSPDRYALSSSLLNRFLVSTLCSLNEVAPKWAELTEQTISRVSGGLYLVNWANSTEPESFDDVVIRHGPPADHLESVFPFIAKQCAPLRGKLRDLALTGWLDNATKQFFTR